MALLSNLSMQTKYIITAVVIIILIIMIIVVYIRNHATTTTTTAPAETKAKTETEIITTAELISSLPATGQITANNMTATQFNKLMMYCKITPTQPICSRIVGCSVVFNYCLGGATLPQTTTGAVPVATSSVTTAST